MCYIAGDTQNLWPPIQSSKRSTMKPLVDITEVIGIGKWIAVSII